MTEKECEHCGKKFDAKNRQLFCSKECRCAKIKCAECGKEHKRNYKNPNGEYICPNCYQTKYKPKLPLVKCVECGKEHKRNYKNSNNKYICSNCYHKKYKLKSPLVKCAECGKECESKQRKNPKGEYICFNCYQIKYKPNSPLVKCVECGKRHKKGNKNSNGEYICPNCYQTKYKPKSPLVKCAECGKECESKQYKNSKGEYICKSCKNKEYRSKIPLIKCAECGIKHKRGHKNSEGKYICKSCYNIKKCQDIINKNNKYNLENKDEVLLFIVEMKKKYSHGRIYRQLECELLGYGNYNKAMNQAMKRDNYTCQITGKKGNTVVHHLNSYNTHKELACDLNNLITLDRDFHNIYHNTCGHGNNTAEQFWRFVDEYKKKLVTLDDFYDTDS